MEDKKIYEINTLPIIKRSKEKPYHFYENITIEEIRNMSCEPRMLWDFGDKVYFAELPLTYRGESVSRSLFYIYDELNQEEQEKYAEKTVTIKTTRPDVVMIYDKREVVKDKKEIKKEKKRTRKLKK